MAPGLAERLRLVWPEAYGPDHPERWVEPLRAALAQHVAVERGPVPQPHRRLTLVDAYWDGEPHRVALDFSDYADELDPAVADSCAAYFKMQFLEEGYGRSHVIPGGYVPGRAHLYDFLPRARAVADRDHPRYEVYGRFSPHYATEVRTRALGLLEDQDSFDYEGELRLATYPTFLRDVARSRVCVDLPGNGEICHRLVDYLAVGACVVRPEPRTRLHVPLEPGRHVTHSSRDLSDLVDRCAELLADPETRAARQAAARDYFDRYLHIDQLAGYYLDRTTALLGA